MRNSPRVRIKMCGMTQVTDIHHAASLGVDAIGLIFFKDSPRCVSIEKARELLQGLSVFVDVVAVVVNPEEAFVQQLLEMLPIQYIQFHGQETASFCEQFGLSYIKAIPASSQASILRAIDDHPRAAALLLDTPSLTRHGGVGVPFDWRIVPIESQKPLILAGGLNSDNVGNAIFTCSPYAVDVNSGIETSPGVKDHQKMTQFVRVVGGKE